MSFEPADPAPVSAPVQPRVFISAVSAEFKTIRQQVAETVKKLGYQPVSMDDWATGDGELRAWLRRQIDSCDGLIHIPGTAYGAEPADHDPAAHGLPVDTPRYSYTQYEFLYARERGIRTWVIQPGPKCTRDHPPAKLDLRSDLPPDEAARLQAQCRLVQQQWLERLRKLNYIRHKPKHDYALHQMLMALSEHARDLRRRFGEWQQFVTGHIEELERQARRQTLLLVGIAAAVVLVAVGVAALLPMMRKSLDQGTTMIAQQHQVADNQAQLAAQLRQVQEALSRIQQNTDSKIDPISQWPQDRLETELALQMNMKVEEVRAIIRAGQTSTDALLQGVALLASGKRDEAAKKFDLVIEQKRSAGDLRQAYTGKGLIAYDQAHYEEALDDFQKAAALVNKESDPLGWADAQMNVIRALYELARYQESEPILREVVRIREEKLGPKAPELATALNSVALLLQATNRPAEAEPLMRRAVTIFETTYGDNHPNVALAIGNLATLLQNTNRLVEAEPLMRRALAIDEASFGKSHPRVAIALDNLGTLLQDTNRVVEAEPLLRRALAIDEASFGENHPSVARDMNNLGTLLQGTGRLAEAEPLNRRAVEIAEAKLGNDHPTVAAYLGNLGALLRDTNRLAEAEPFLRRALKITEASLGPNHPDVAIRLNSLALLLHYRNQLREAEPLFRRALAIDEASLGMNHPKVAVVLTNLALLLRDTNRLAEAEPLMRRALAIDEANSSRDLAGALGDLARLLQVTNRLAEAEPLFRRALEIDEACLAADNPHMALDFNDLAVLLTVRKRQAEADPLAKRAIDIFFSLQAHTGHEDHNSLPCFANYVILARGMGRSFPQIHAQLDVERQKAGLDQASFESLWNKALATYSIK